MPNVKNTGKNNKASPTSQTIINDDTLYKTILQTSMDGFIMLGEDGNILEVNNAYCKLSGYSRKELLSMNIADVEVLESHSKIKKHIKFLNKTGSQGFITKHRCKHGNIIELEVSANSIKHNHITTFAFFRDITQRIQAQKALQASEERFHSTMDNMLEGCQIISRDWKYLYINNAVIKQSRKSKEQLIGHTMMEVYPDFEKTPVFSVLQDCMEHFKSRHIENEFQFPNGTKGWFILSIQPVPEGIFILSLDITDRIKAQKALLEAKRDWENIFQAIGQPSFILDPEQGITAVNRATVSMTGKSAKQLVGNKCYKIFHKKNSPPEECPFKKIPITGHMETREMEIEIFDGIFIVSCTPIFNEQGILEKVIHIATDINELKDAERKILDYQKQLKQMASEILLAEEHERHRIAAGIHDDIGQRLAIIKFGLDSLKASESRPEILSFLKRQNELIINAIENVRSFTFELSNPLLYEIGVEAAIETWLTEHLQNQCGIKCGFFSNGPKLNLSEKTKIILFKGVRELLTNIIKHANADYVSVNIVRNNNSMQINIKDNGIGFNSSLNNKPEKEKKGFGLFNLREKLEYLGGKLEIDNASPQGTFATIYIPVENNKNICEDSIL